MFCFYALCCAGWYLIIIARCLVEMVCAVAKYLLSFLCFKSEQDIHIENLDTMDYFEVNV